MAGVVIAGGVWLFALSQKNPVLRLRVVAESGKPVSGATIHPDGIRGNDRAHYGWRADFAVKPREVVSDADGRAAIEYPRYIQERIRSIQISFGLQHPEFAADRLFLTVGSLIPKQTPVWRRLLFIAHDAQYAGKVHTVVLKRAATLEVTASRDGKEVPADKFYLLVACDTGVQPKEFLVRGSIRLSHQMPAGNFLIRAAYLEPDGKAWFSSATQGVAVTGETNRFDLELMPGLSVSGRLQGMDGPVTNGWVNARVIARGNFSKPIFWADYAPVENDGTFTLTNLPPGTLECLSVCDGYLSQTPKGKMVSGSVYPHSFDLPAEGGIILPMTASGEVEVRVIDPLGQPVPGATVGSWPNVQWANYSSTIFASDFYSTADWLAGEDGGHRSTKRGFTAATDERGVARISELPPGRQHFAIQHDKWELPINSNDDRYETITVAAGETNWLTLKVQPKGKQQREQ